MKIPPLREESRADCLERIFCKIRTKSEISLWQNLDGDRRSQRAILYKVAAHSQTLNFMPTQGNNFGFDARKPIYFYEKKNLVIFKTRLMFHSGFRIEIPFPEHILTPELRESSRVQASDFDDEHVKFELRNNLGVALFQKPLLDYSDSGASFRINEQERNVFIHSSLLRMSPPHQRGVLVNARIRYVELLQEGRYSGSRFFRVGVQYQ